MARISITGDTAKLARRIRSITYLRIIASKAAEKTVPVIESLIRREFLYTKSPYGVKWAPLKRPTGLPPIRGLKDYFDVVAPGSVVYVSNEKFYAKFHQTGTRFMPAREFLPEGQLSPTWRDKIYKAITKAVRSGVKREGGI